MNLHTIAYVLANLPDQWQNLGAIPDDVFYGSGPDGFLIPRDLKLFAAYASGDYLDAVQLQAPSLLRVVYPSIDPIQQTIGGVTPNDPNLMNLLRNPVTLRGGERLVVRAKSMTSMTSTKAVVVLLVGQDIDPAPHGEAFTVRYATTEATVADRWSQVSPVLDQNLPAGRYAVLGVNHHGPTAIAVRLSLAGLSVRPGALAVGGANPQYGFRNNDLFYSDDLGVLGSFDTTAPPLLQVLTSMNDAAASHAGFLRLVRLNGLGQS